MNDTSAQHPIVLKLEKIIITTLQILLISAVAVATLILCYLFARGLVLVVPQAGSVEFLHQMLDRTFGGVLIVFLGLELLETFKVYFKDQEVRVEAVIVVAIIAVGRHVIEVDLEHTPGFVLIGIAALLMALTTGYFLIKRSLHARV